MNIGSQIVDAIFSPLEGVVEGMTKGITTAFEHLLWQDPAAEVKVLSDVAQFGLVFLGVGIVTGLVYLGFKLLRR
jgi:hypothetical protein